MGLNQNGFSIGYLLVVMGIGMIIALALSNMTLDSMKSAKNVEQNLEINNLALEVQSVLENTQACKNSFLGLTPNDAIFTENIKDKSGALRFQKNETYGTNDVIINGYSFGIKDHAGANMGPVIGANTTGISYLRVSVKKTSQASGASIVERRIPIFVKTDLVGSVASCSARPLSGELTTASINCMAPRTGFCSKNSSDVYPGFSFDYCSLEVVRSGGNDGGGRDVCGVRKVGVGQWQVYGDRGDDPRIECRMVCFSLSGESLPPEATRALDP